MSCNVNKRIKGVLLGELVDVNVFSTNSMKMSRRPTILEHFSKLDVHYNLNFLGVDVKGRCCFIFGALFLALCTPIE